VAAREAGILVNGGGHKMAAGLTIESARVADLTVFLSRRLAEDCALSNEKTLSIDGALSASGATAEMCDLIAKCGPYGAGNVEPIFVLPSVRAAFASVVGEQHVRCVLMSAGGGRVAAIAFRALQSPLGAALLGAKGRPLHVVCSLKADTWDGERRVQATIRDAVFAA
jgi:single-stranded-DNA-specific exonuclease